MLTIPSTLLPALRNALGAIVAAKGGKLTVSHTGTDRAGNRLVCVKGEREATYSAIGLPEGCQGAILALMGVDGEKPVGAPDLSWRAGLGRELEESRSEVASLKRTVEKLRVELEARKAAPAPAAPVPQTLILTFPQGQQSKILKAAKLDVAKIKDAGFKWRFHRKDEPSEGGQWEALESHNARAIFDAVSAFL